LRTEEGEIINPPTIQKAYDLYLARYNDIFKLSFDDGKKHYRWRLKSSNDVWSEKAELRIKTLYKRDYKLVWVHQTVFYTIEEVLNNSEFCSKYNIIGSVTNTTNTTNTRLRCDLDYVGKY
jgi:hypothetical protein